MSIQQIARGISVDSSGQATVDPALSKVLFDLAIHLEGPTRLPVDVQHVVAAIALAARSGELDADTQISAEDPDLARLLAVHVKTIFKLYGGKVGRDD